MSEAKLKEEIDGSIYMALKGDSSVTFTTPIIIGINTAIQGATPNNLNLIEKLKPMKRQRLFIKLVSWKQTDLFPTTNNCHSYLFFPFDFMPLTIVVFYSLSIWNYGEVIMYGQKYMSGTNSVVKKFLFITYLSHLYLGKNSSNLGNWIGNKKNRRQEVHY